MNILRADLDDEAHLKQLNFDIGCAQDRGREGRAFLDRALSEDLIFRRACGKVFGKHEFLAALGDPAKPGERRRCDSVQLRVVGTRALATLIVAIGEDDQKRRYLNIRVFSKSGRGWQVDAWYNYNLMEPCHALN